MRYAIVGLFLLAACGKDVVAPPPPPPVVETGTIYFALQNCQSYTTVDYVVDSITVGTEAVGPISQGYTVTAGVRSAKARVSRAGSPNLWTYNDRVTVPANGSVTARPAC